MTPSSVLLVLLGYFLILILISNRFSKSGDSKTFFTANRQSPWYVVAFGMIGVSLSGVTFISVPGWVASSQFSYMQMVLGYLLGYFVIARVLLPLYYRLNLVSIYTYLEERFGFWSYKSGAFYFLLSRTIQASFRLFLVAGVLQLAVFGPWGVPFWVSVLITIALIYLYTFRGGIGAIIWTDTLQTFFMLSAVVVIIYIMAKDLDWSVGEVIANVNASEYSQVFFWDWRGSQNFFKQFFSGAFIAIVMTGLDQDVMQKNLTCRSLPEAQKNVYWLSVSLVFVNILFLSLGVLLYQYADINSIALPARGDDLFPMLAINHFPAIAGIIFLLGITAAAYSSADSALTALTTSFCVDFLGFKLGENDNVRLRKQVHVLFATLLFIVIVIFHYILDQSVISSLFTAAGYTYGPLLGMFAFGIYTRRAVQDKYVPVVCLLSPALSFGFKLLIESAGSYKMGYELLLANGLITFLGLWLISYKKNLEISSKS